MTTRRIDKNRHMTTRRIAIHSIFWMFVVFVVIMHHIENISRRIMYQPGRQNREKIILLNKKVKRA